MRLVDDKLPPRAEMVRAMLDGDPAYAGSFVVAVRTTLIFCRTTCPARKPDPRHVEFFCTAVDALAAGFRPCKHCRPLQLPESPPPWIEQLLRQVESDRTGPWTDARLQREQIGPIALRHWCRQHLGMSFHALVRARRLGLALGQLQAAGTSAAPPAHLPRLRFSRLMTPLGPMLAMAEDRGLVLLEFLDRPALAPEIENLRSRHGYGVEPGAHPHIAQVRRELEAYFAGQRRRFMVPVRAPGSAFDVSVWSALLEIPFGETRSYADLATQLRRPGAFRAVGAANGRNRIAVVIPCHRVIGTDGSLTGYGGGQARKAHLIRLEQSALGLGATAGVAAADAGCEPAGHLRSFRHAVEGSVLRVLERGAQGAE